MFKNHLTTQTKYGKKKKNFDIFGQVSQVHGITLHNHPHKNEKQKHANM